MLLNSNCDLKICDFGLARVEVRTAHARRETHNLPVCLASRVPRGALSPPVARRRPPGVGRAVVFPIAPDTVSLLTAPRPPRFALSFVRGDGGNDNGDGVRSHALARCVSKFGNPERSGSGIAMTDYVATRWCVDGGVVAEAGEGTFAEAGRDGALAHTRCHDDARPRGVRGWRWWH